ncbi:MAG: hypothetical protein GY810_24380 [Aureispira sp.]|nr:hypothetical protein [Aureispira sp.]
MSTKDTIYTKVLNTDGELSYYKDQIKKIEVLPPSTTGNYKYLVNKQLIVHYNDQKLLEQLQNSAQEVMQILELSPYVLQIEDHSNSEQIEYYNYRRTATPQYSKWHYILDKNQDTLSKAYYINNSSYA